jgi:polysaccharide export outer membrane protein
VKNLEAELKQKYSEYFKDADLTITFQSANIKIEELKKAITTAPRGQSRLMPVKPDGKITLPFLTDTLAYGKTIEELKSELDNKYQNDAGIPELEVTVQILAVAPRKIYVFGEVNRPGIIEVSNMITLTQAVAIAGGTNTRADSTKILVVRRKDMPSPEGVVVDLDQMLSSIIKVDGIERPDAKKWTRDFWLDDYDLVYVPTSSMTKSNDWINQVFTRGIYSVVPFSTSVNMGFGYQTYNAPSAYSNNNAGKEQLGNLANTILSR